MKLFKVFYIYTIQAETKTEAMRLVEESRKSVDPHRLLSVSFAREEVPQSFFGAMLKQVLG